MLKAGTWRPDGSAQIHFYGLDAFAAAADLPQVQIGPHLLNGTRLQGGWDSASERKNRARWSSKSDDFCYKETYGSSAEFGVRGGKRRPSFSRLAD